MLVETLQALVRAYYHVLGAQRIVRETETARVRGFLFDPEREPDRTIVLVHGLGDASTTWYKLVGALRHEARLVLVDLPPFGRSELHDGYAVGPRQHARLLAPFVDEHATGRTTIVGQSMGGWVAQWFVHDHPELVDAAVLVATAGARLEGSFDAVDLLTPHAPGEAMAYLDALWARRPLGLQAVLGDVMRRLHAPEVRGFLALTEHGHTLSEQAFADAEIPLHVVWGKEDGLLDAGTPAYLAERWGGPVDRSYLAGAGHMVHHERPGALLSIVRAIAEPVAEPEARRARPTVS